VFDSDIDLDSYTDGDGNLVVRDVYIQLPGSITQHYTADDKFIIKQLYGRTLAIYNNSSYGIGVNNIGTSVPIPSGEFRIFRLDGQQTTEGGVTKVSHYYWTLVDSGSTSDLPFA
jgi:hypothetical protein